MHPTVPAMPMLQNASPIRQGALAVVVGTGRSGMAAARLLHCLGARVRVLEKDSANIPDHFMAMAQQHGFECLHGAHTAEQFFGADLVVPSPGVPVASLLPYLDVDALPEIRAEIDLAYACVREPVLAVTGTSGKTTTASLCDAMLRAAGKRVFLGGNIGTPLSEYVMGVAAGEQPADILVLEASSFQLQTCTAFHPHVAVLLNIAPNHLDYHADMQEYRDAKFRIFARQGSDDLAILQAGMEGLAKEYGLAAQQEFFAPARRFVGAVLPGAHNAANMEAAWLACRAFGVTLEQARQAVSVFRPLEHRLEHVAETGGVLFVNDSKATTVDAMQAALESFTRPILLLCGGKLKGGDLASLIPLLRRRVKAVALFGGSREAFEKAWSGAVPMTWDADLGLAMRRMCPMAQPGDVVLLSPGTASFDGYKNYQERGMDFKNHVKVLAKEFVQ